MKINLERINDKYLFEVTNKNGHKVHLDRKYSDDYNVQGSSPMELLLMGVAIVRPVMGRTAYRLPA